MEEAGAAGAHEVEDAAPLLEEAPALGEEEGEPIERDLLTVGFDLGEVGVGGEVQREIPRQRVARIDTHIPRGLTLPREAGTRLPHVMTRRAAEHVGGQVQRRAAPHPTQDDVLRDGRTPEREFRVDGGKRRTLVDP